MFCMAGYGRKSTGKFLGDLLKRCQGNAGLTSDEARGTVDAGQWSRMLSGDNALDINALFDELTPDAFLDFLSRLSVEKVKKHAPVQKAKVA